MESSETVLITGASSGIGYELAKIFAMHNYNLILVSRSEGKLNSLANELINMYNIKIYIIAQDLSKPGAAQKIFNNVNNLHCNVDILVNNAGSGNVGMFHEIELEKQMETIQLNICALTEITKLFSVEMIKRKKGKILNVASTGAFSPGPFIAVYYATKAYVLSFSQAISQELKPYNITVTTLCPGATKTNFAKAAGKRDVSVAMNPDLVAKAAYNGLKKGKKIVVPGILNKILIRLPKTLVSKINFKNQKKLLIEK